MEEYVDPFPFFFDDEEVIEKPERRICVGAKFPFHEHLVYPRKGSRNICVGCGKVRVDPDGGYVCNSPGGIWGFCEKFFVHKGCIEIYNPSHPTHPLTLTDFSEYICCSICNGDIWGHGYTDPFCPGIAVCRGCVRKELYIDPKKSHEHPLFVLLKTFFSFPCDACGLTDDSSLLCLCIPCRITIHRQCVDLPRVICVNRHDHRISHVPRLGPGEWDCGVCRKTIDGRYGAYSCSTCSFASHSRCATRGDVWDGIELEGVPEDDPEDVIPFKVVEEGVIKHFTHEHNLRFINEDDIGYDKNKQCYACVLPIFSEPCYICKHCDFILHETCANLPRKKRHMSHRNQFTLYEPAKRPFECRVCYQMCNGFVYATHEHAFVIDVRCVSIYDGYVHKSQPNSMLLAPDNSKYDTNDCSTCGETAYHRLIVSGHDNLFICYKCATTPAQVIYKYDDHPLSLLFGENITGDYWCEICEKKMDSQKWFIRVMNVVLLFTLIAYLEYIHI